jgi:plastocyanin
MSSITRTRLVSRLSRDRIHWPVVIAFTLFSLHHARASGGDLDVVVLDPSGRGAQGVVVVAETPLASHAKHPPKTEVMDQRSMQFVPAILVIQTGTAVDFPNSDQSKHQVYSFSPAKTFQLSLYAGRHYDPVIFDKAGLVTVGCNIHDQMIGYIYVTDSPYFGQTDDTGHLALHGLPVGSYTVKVWHPGLDGADSRAAVGTSAVVEGQGTTTAVLHLTRTLHAEHTHAKDKRWVDY